MWPWKKPGEQGDQAAGGPPEGSEHMAEETQHSDMTDSEGNPGGEVQDRIVQLEAELEDARGRALRLMADFQNYQRRALQNEVVARQQGVAGLAGSVANVVDHFDTALAQSGKASTPEQILTGLKLIRDELVKALAQHGVTTISPQPGELFEPGRHEAVMQQQAEGIDPGHVVSTFQPGYVLAGSAGSNERVIRPAKVVVAPTE
jgi:molecular chaperone GrpE